ncbi:MAG: hypothetical protein KDB27_13590 [Planctomycetales bacterium]|nr:hypothetical protein [Planctomycetales bacterium]
MIYFPIGLVGQRHFLFVVPPLGGIWHGLVFRLKAGLQTSRIQAFTKGDAVQLGECEFQPGIMKAAALDFNRNA